MDETTLFMSRRRFLKAAGTTLAAGGVLGGMRLGPLTLAEAHAQAAQTGETVVPTWCAMCGPASNCGVYCFVKNGVFTHVAGMKEAPQNKGALCCKAHASAEWVYSPERIQYPLRRIGRKGEGKFERVTWDEAIKTIATTLQEQKTQFGPESLGILSPARRDYSDYEYRFLMAHGSPNYGHSGICAMQLFFIMNYTLGVRPGPDYANADLVLIWGKQPIFSGPPLGSGGLVGAFKRGARIYAIKPSVEVDGNFATEWVPVRPGTDAALGLAMIHVIVKENLIDQDFVEKWCFGYDKLVEHVKSFTPEWAEKKCGVSAAQIIKVARDYATTPKASIDFGNGLEHSNSASDAIRCVAILMAITGHLDKPGCNSMTGFRNEMPSMGNVHMKERYTQEWVDKLVGPEFPKAFQPFIEGTSAAYSRLFEDVLTDKPVIHTIIAPGTQPLVSTRNTKRMIEALKKLDFYVVANTHRTSDMAWADIVIPCATPYEIDHPFGTRGPLLMARNKVIEPITEGRSMQQFLADLAVAMGYGDDYWHGDMNECQNELLKRTKMSIDDLRAHATGVVYKPMERNPGDYESLFKVRSPRISKEPYLPQGKIAIYNTSFEEAGFPPLPGWTDPVESFDSQPELAKKYPLVLSDYHTSISYSAGWQREVPRLREIEPDPVLHIHPETAKARNIKHGDDIIVEGKMGFMAAKAEYYPGVRKDTVMILHGWWQGCQELDMKDMPLTDGGANVNAMYENTPEAYDPLVTAMTSQTLVQVRKA